MTSPPPVEQPSLTGEPTEKPQRNPSQSSEYSDDEKKKGAPTDPETAVLEKDAEREDAQSQRSEFYARYRPLILGSLAVLILAWWISATVLKATRHRWYANQSDILQSKI